MRHDLSILLFCLASLLPAACLVAAALLGGGWVWAALLSMTALVLALDRAGIDAEASAGAARWLPWAVGGAHFAALATGLWAVGHQPALDTGAKLLLVVTLGLYAGQVSNACAHELIHRRERAARRLGTAIYCSLLNGQHVSAHMLVHHVHAGTAQDPNSAPPGRGFYRFALTVARREFTDGWRAETRRRATRPRGAHPYAIYLGGAALSLGAALALGGGWGLLALLAIALHAQMQLILSDYVQHYGLRRRPLADGRPEPMGPQHSWNAPHAYSAALMLNAPRHSDHHMNPGRDLAALDLSETTMPQLPYSLPVMGAIALVPPLWRRVMDPRLRAWTGDAAQEAARTATAPDPLLSR